MIRLVCLIAILATLPAVTDRPMSAAHLTTPTSGVHAGTLSGKASWYRTPGLTGAAGPRLRRSLGPDWRGNIVKTCLSNDPGRCVTVKLTDWCGCYGTRLIDLSDDAFRELAPLPVGVVDVTVAPVQLPATDR